MALKRLVSIIVAMTMAAHMQPYHCTAGGITCISESDNNNNVIITFEVSESDNNNNVIITFEVIIYFKCYNDIVIIIRLRDTCNTSCSAVIWLHA